MVRFLMIVVGEFQELGQSSWWESFRAAVSETGGEGPPISESLNLNQPPFCNFPPPFSIPPRHTGRWQSVYWHLNLHPPHCTFCICNVKSHYLSSITTRPVTIPCKADYADCYYIPQRLLLDWLLPTAVPSPLIIWR